MEVPVQSLSPVAATYPVVKSSLESPQSRDDTIASNASPILDEETAMPSPIPVEIEEPKPELIAMDSCTQTGKSLTLSPEKQIHTQVQTDSLAMVPSAVAIQTEDAEWLPKEVQKSKIKVLQKIEGDEETIEIATRSNIESHDKNVDQETRSLEDLTVELKYKGNKEGQDQAMTISELNILHNEPQSFETVVMNPGESSMEVIVDADGTKRIIMKKSRRIISHYQHTLTSGSNIETIDTNPIAFSQATLEQQQKSVTHVLPDGRTEITTSQGYAGQITRGTHDGDLTTSHFSNLPRQEIAAYHTLPKDMNVSEALHASEFGLSEPTGIAEWASSSSTVRAVVHQVRRKIIKRTRRIIRKVTIIDGKEHITEEVVEEPEEVEVCEEGIPRVSFEISKDSQGAVIVQEPFEEQDYSEDPGVEISEINSEGDTVGSYNIKEISPNDSFQIEQTSANLSNEPSSVTETAVLCGDNSKNDVNILFIANESANSSLVDKDIDTITDLQVASSVAMPIELQKGKHTESKKPKTNVNHQKKDIGLKDQKDKIVNTNNKVKAKNKDMPSAPENEAQTYIGEEKCNEEVSGKSENVLVSSDQSVKSNKKGKSLKSDKKSSKKSDQYDKKSSKKIDSPATSHLTDNLKNEENVFSTIDNVDLREYPSKVRMMLNSEKGSPEINEDKNDQSKTNVLKYQIPSPSEMKQDLDKNVLPESKNDMTIQKRSRKKIKVKSQNSETPTEHNTIIDSSAIQNIESEIPLKDQPKCQPVEKDINGKKSHQLDKNNSLKKDSPPKPLMTDKLEIEIESSGENIGYGHKGDVKLSVYKDALGSHTDEKEKVLSEMVTDEPKKDMSSLKESNNKIQPKEGTLDSKNSPEEDISNSKVITMKPDTPILQPENEQGFGDDPDSNEFSNNDLFINNERDHSSQLMIKDSLSLKDPNASSDCIKLEIAPKQDTIQRDEIDVKENNIENESFISSSKIEVGQLIVDSQKDKTSIVLPDSNIIFPSGNNANVNLYPKTDTTEIISPGFTTLEGGECFTEPSIIISPNCKEVENIEQTTNDNQIISTQDDKSDVLNYNSSADKLSNIEIEISIGENLIGQDEIIPKVKSETKVEQKLGFGSSEDEMIVVKQKSDVVLPGVVEVTREIIKLQSPELSISSKESTKKTGSPDNLSTPTSLAESMEIVISGTPNSSDTTKPTQQEMFDVLSPRSDISQIDESVKTSDTGYDGEDKTTVDESSVIDNNTSKSKKKKKRKQKIKVVDSINQESSIEPKSSDFVPSDAIEEKDDKIDVEKVKKHKGKKLSKKYKAEHITDVQTASTKDEVISEGSLKEISEDSICEKPVKIVEESIPIRPSSVAEEFTSVNTLTSVPVLEVLPTLSESVQTTTPVPLPKDLVDTTEVSLQTTQETQEVSAQTVIPEYSFTEAYIQTSQAELVPTSDEAAQTIPSNLQPNNVETTDSIVQTAEEIIPDKQEEEIQTDYVKFSSLDNVDSSMQTLAEVHPVYQEGTVQTSPEPDKIQTSSQVVISDLIKTEEEESQTVEHLIETTDLSTQIINSDLIPVYDQFVQTIVEENISPIIHELSDKREVDVQRFNETEKDASTKDSLPVEIMTDKTSEPVRKTENSLTQTRPVKFKEDIGSDDSLASVGYPVKIEIEAVVTYEPETETDMSTSDSKSDSYLTKHPYQVCTASPESTDSDVSSWASHAAKYYHPKSNKGEESKQSKRKTKGKSDTSPVNNENQDYEIIKVNETHVEYPDMKAKVQFDVEEYNTSLTPQLTAEVSQDKHASSVFIQAELMQASSRVKMPSVSQLVEFDMSSKPKAKQPSKTLSKLKKDRKIRQRSDTKGLPQASLVLGPEELRGEHSPGPPKERENSEDAVDEKLGHTKTHSKTEYSVNLEVIDLPLAEAKTPDVITSEDKQITWKTDASEECKQFSQPVEEFNTIILSPEKMKIETEMFIDSETTSDTKPSINIITDDQDTKIELDKKKTTDKLKSIDSNDTNSDTMHPSKLLSEKSDELKSKEINVPKESSEILDSQWKQMSTLISDRLRNSQNPPASTQIIYLKPLDHIEISQEERAHQLENNLDNLQHAVKQQDRIDIQQTIIITVETISTWLETIEYKIQHTKVSSDLY